MGPYGYPDDAFVSKFMGSAYVFKLKTSHGVNNPVDQRAHKIDVMLATKKVMVGLQMHKMPQIRYPYATKRVCGRVNPGEVERKARKAGERKQTRADVEMLCKYMLFKNGKFMPGKMV